MRSGRWFQKWIPHAGLALILVILPAVCLAASEGPREKESRADGCTSIIVGRAASVDGSTMTSHSCDSNSDRTWINLVPHLHHPPGSMCKIYFEPKLTKGPDDPDRLDAGEIPQVPETYAYINTAYPVMNEFQLAIGETTFGGKRELKSEKGLIDCPELYRLVLERARTAREAIRIADELTKTYGYIDYGECFTFADPNETWFFEILGPGKGKKGAVWAAVRIPDDHVGVSANASRIRTVDPADSENCLASDNVFSLAREMGWWDPEGGRPFEFCTAYASRRSMGSRRREWRVLSLVAPSIDLDPNGEHFPLSVRPDKKLSVQDLLRIFRDTYQDTPFDMTRGMNVVRNDQGKVKANPSPVASPFLNRDLMSLLGVEMERTICCSRATYLQITQSRSWLPNPIGGVVWLGYDNPAATPHTPFYCGISSMPGSYEIDGREKYRRDCAWWAFRRVSQLAQMRWHVIRRDVEKVWREIEDKVFTDQAEVERKALEIYQDDPGKAGEFLTEYCCKIALGAVERYWDLGDELWSRYTRYF